MSLWFIICAGCFFIAIPLHFGSVEHTKLVRKYGEEKGIRVGKMYGAISGTMELLLLIGLWVSPQPTFVIPILQDLAISICDASIPLLHLVISLPLTAVGAWFGIEGARTTGWEAAETHSLPKKILTTGVYSIVRHPQYFGWSLVQAGMSVLFCAWYSMLFTPVLLVLIYLISKKEEDELIKEFGKEYKDYQKNVPMLIPGWK